MKKVKKRSIRSNGILDRLCSVLVVVAAVTSLCYILKEPVETNNNNNLSMVTYGQENTEKETETEEVEIISVDVPNVTAGVQSAMMDLIHPKNDIVHVTEMQPTLYAGLNANVYRTFTLDTYLSQNTNEMIVSSIVEEDIEEEPVIVYNYENTGYATTTLNIRKEPKKSSEKLGSFEFNEKICYSYLDNDSENGWGAIEYGDSIAYVSLKYISDEQANYKELGVDGDKRKSYMDWTCITSKSSPQYKIQHNYAYTDSNGVRAVDGRYCIALGSYYTHDVGRWVDLVLEDGSIIECIIGDCKADRDTVNNHSMGIDGGVAEFIVETSALPKRARQMGDVSYSTDGWLQNVVSIRIYDKNILE